MFSLDRRRRRLRTVLVGAALLGIGSASLSGALAALSPHPPLVALERPL
jgi:hypothetical protein